MFERLADLGVPRIHFGVGTGELLGLMAAAGADVVGVDWRTPLSVARARVGAGRALQGNLDPAVCLGPWDGGRGRGAAVLAENGGHPGHVFNLGHGVLPETDPAVLERVVDLVHAEGKVGRTVTRSGVVVMAYGTPGLARRRRGVLHPHPPGPAAGAGAARRPARPLRGHRRHLAAAASITEAQAARIGAALGDGFARRPRHEARAPFIEDAVARLAGRRGRRDRRPRAGAPLQPGVGGRVPRAAGEGRGRPTAWRRPRSSRGTTCPRTVDFLAAAVRDGLAALPARTKVRVHRPLAARARARRRPVPRPAARLGAAASPTPVGLDRGRAGRSPGSRPAGTPEPWRGPDILEVIDDLAGTGRADGVLVCPQGFVADHLEVLYDLDVRRRGARRRRSASPSPAPQPQRRPDGRSAALAERAIAPVRRRA